MKAERGNISRLKKEYIYINNTQVINETKKNTTLSEQFQIPIENPSWFGDKVIYSPLFT